MQIQATSARLWYSERMEPILRDTSPSQQSCAPPRQPPNTRRDERGDISSQSFTWPQVCTRLHHRERECPVSDMASRPRRLISRRCRRDADPSLRSLDRRKRIWLASRLRRFLPHDLVTPRTTSAVPSSRS